MRAQHKTNTGVTVKRKDHSIYLSLITAANKQPTFSDEKKIKGKVNLINLGTAFSLANLWFIAFWKSPAYSVDNYYYDSQPYTLLEYLAVFIDVLIVTGILAIFIKLSTSSNTWLRRIFQVVFLILGLLAFCPLSSEIIKWVSPETINFLNIPLPIVILTICVLFSLKEKKFKLQNVTEKFKAVRASFAAF